MGSDWYEKSGEAFETLKAFGERTKETVPFNTDELPFRTPETADEKRAVRKYKIKLAVIAFICSGIFGLIAVLAAMSNYDKKVILVPACGLVAVAGVVVALIQLFKKALILDVTVQHKYSRVSNSGNDNYEYLVAVNYETEDKIYAKHDVSVGVLDYDKICDGETVYLLLVGSSAYAVRKNK